ncbi:MAG: hypothetical protein MI717_11530 [Spirochaetales bacterium]|nr:hypothetical protein [Spirochaetales bacterium]
MPALKKPKKSVISLSPHVILTDSGVSFFMEKGYKLSKLSMADGTERYGVCLAQVNPPSFQHMLRIGYISRLEVSRPEFTTVRGDLMDLSKLIVYGFLYKQFDQQFFDSIIDSGMIKEWNRNNPGNIIDERTKYNESFLREAIKKNDGQIKTLKRAILNPLVSEIAQDSLLNADEKNARVFMAERFLEYSRPFIWFILMRFQSYSEHKLLIAHAQDLLRLHINRSKIADYLTLLLMELSLSAETLNMVAFAERKYGEAMDASSLLFDPAKREVLLEAMEGAGADFTVAWRVGNANTLSLGWEKRLELVIYNREAGYLDLKEKVEANMKGTKMDSLAQFYERTDTGNAEMGLHYLSYLQEACDEVGMRLTSRVGEVRSGLPAITLTLQF